MRTISAQAITDTVARLCIEANTRLPKDVEAALAKARAEEPWPLAKNTLDIPHTVYVFLINNKAT